MNAARLTEWFSACCWLNDRYPTTTSMTGVAKSRLWNISKSVQKKISFHTLFMHDESVIVQQSILVI